MSTANVIGALQAENAASRLTVVRNGASAAH